MDTKTGATAPARRGILAAWQFRQFRLLWIAMFTTNIARWMDVIVAAWLILELTNSPFMVGVGAAIRTAGMIAGPFCGIVADRFDRRKTLAVTQLVWALTSMTIMVLFFTARLEVWHLLVYVAVAGLGHAIDLSTQFALASDVVNGRYLTNAISVLYATSSFAGGIGPFIGGSLLDLIHASGAFAIISSGLFFAFVILAVMKVEPRPRPAQKEPARTSLVQGFRYIASDRGLLTFILIAALINLFIAPIKQTLMAVYARETLQVTASGLGQILGVAGVGGLLGSLLSGSLERSANKGKFFIAGLMTWPVVYIILSASKLFYFSMGILFIAGAAEGFTYALLQSLIIQRSAPEMRGRVSGMRSFAISTMLIGNLVCGAAAGAWGAPAAILGTSLAFAAVCLVTVAWAAKSWKIR